MCHLTRAKIIIFSSVVSFPNSVYFILQSKCEPSVSYCRSGTIRRVHLPCPTGTPWVNAHSLLDLQMGYFPHKAERDYVMIEKESVAGIVRFRVSVNAVTTVN